LVKIKTMDFKKTNMDIRFPSFPVEYGWIERDYERCKTFSDYVAFIHKCFNEGENCFNPVNKKLYIDTALKVYSKLMGTNYESIIFTNGRED
tara:strand:+ start:18160 stop:18435 length:276 start_codon:yes stop_codon:yes gene_type:complete